MFKSGRSVWVVGLVGGFLASVTPGAGWLGAEGQQAWAASPLVIPDQQPAIRCAADDPAIGLAPYVWKRTGAGVLARAEATMPGAYLKTVIQGSTWVRLLLDGTANQGCPAAAMPIIDYSVDDGPFKSVQLTKSAEIYALPLAEGLDGRVPHRLEVHFRSAALGPGRWTASTVHLRIAGLELESGGSLRKYPQRPQLALGYGDSITEGVCNEGLGPYYSNLLLNNARATWFPLVCTALNCEYGQLGTGGQGMVRPIEIPPLPQTWDRYDATASRLTGELLLPEPNYIFCAMGTNDFRRADGKLEHLDLTAAYTGWLTAVRKACPTAHCFCVVPPLGWHAAEIAAAVAARQQAGDRRVHLIDTALLRTAFHESRGTQLAPDGVHPSVYGNALLATLITAEVQKKLSQAAQP